MAYSGVLEDIKAAVALKVPKQVPVFALSEEFDVEICGLTHSEYTHDVDKMSGCRIEAVKRFDYDWSCGWPDDFLEFEPLGVKLKGEENLPLAPYEWPPASWDTLKNLKIPGFHREGRMPGYLEVTNRVKKEFADTVCVTGRIAAPFTAVALLYGVENSMILLNEDPELFRKTAEFLCDLMTGWGKAQIGAGADAIWVGDCVAGSGFISPVMYSEYALDSAKKLNAALKREGAFVFYHAGDSSLPHLKLMADTGPSALSVGGKIKIGRVKEALGRKVCLMGNIHGIETLQYGSREKVERETAAIMEEGKKGGGYIFNSEEGIPPGTPEENVKAMMQTARRHSLCS